MWAKRERNLWSCHWTGMIQGKAFLPNPLYYLADSTVFIGLIHFLGNTRETILEACFFLLSHRQCWNTMKVVFSNGLISRLWFFPLKESVGGRKAYETINLWSFLKHWSCVLTKSNQQTSTGSLWGHLMLNKWLVSPLGQSSGIMQDGFKKEHEHREE